MSGVAARRLAIEALVRIDSEGAFANIVLPKMLERSDLEARDRGFVTELVYGTTRMQRTCDFLVDRFLMSDVEPLVRSALRIGAYQLVVLQTPAHAAVGETVGAVPKRVRGIVNAVLRKVAKNPVSYPSRAIELSYPDWMVDRLTADLGEDAAVQSLAVMNTPAPVTERDDGYVQDPSSQLVTELVPPAARVLDMCAAPGGKATGLRAEFVVAADRTRNRASLITRNAARLDRDDIAVVVADGARSPYRPASFDAVLLDAPCSGLGALRRRPDARWRIDEAGIERLAALQGRLLIAAAELVKPGGAVIYSVCTLTDAESVDVVAHAPDILESVPVGDAWEPHGSGGRLLPHETNGDGMCAFAFVRR